MKITDNSNLSKNIFTLHKEFELNHAEIEALEHLKEFRFKEFRTPEEETERVAYESLLASDLVTMDNMAWHPTFVFTPLGYKMLNIKY